MIPIFCLDNTDTLEGGASVTNVVDYTAHGLVAGVFTQLAAGQLSDTDPSVLYTAGAAVSVVAVTMVNTHSSAVTVNLYLDPANGGNPRRMIPEDLSLGIGYSMHFDGQRCMVMNPSGQVLTIPINVSDAAYAAGWNGDTGIAASKNAIYDQMELRAPKASPTFTGQATIPTVDLTGGQIAFPATAVPSADPNTIDDYEEGNFTPEVADALSAGNTGSAGTAQGQYTKIGRLVSLSFRLINIDTTGLTAGNDFYIRDFPFAIEGTFVQIGIVTTVNITFAGFLSLYGPGSATFVRMCESISGAGQDFTIISQIADDTADLRSSFTYNI